MLDPQPQYELNDSPTRFSNDIRAGRLAAIEILIRGTTATGETLAPEDVADTVQVDWDGQSIVTCDFAFLHDWFGIPYGSVVADTPTAGDTRLAAYLPFFIPEAPQSIPVGSDEMELNISFNGTTLDTRFDSDGYVVEITPLYGAELDYRYDFRIERDTITQDDQETYDKGNVAHLLFELASGATNDRVDIEVDDRSVIRAGASLDNLKRVAGVFKSVESDTLPDLIDYSMIKNAQGVMDAINGSVEVDLRGSGDCDVTIVRIPNAEANDLR